MKSNGNFGKLYYWVKIIGSIVTFISLLVRIWEFKSNQKSAKEQQSQKHADKLGELKHENDLKNQNAEAEHKRKMEEMKFANDLRQQNAAADHARKMEEVDRQHAHRMELLAAKKGREGPEEPIANPKSRAEPGRNILERVRNSSGRRWWLKGLLPIGSTWVLFAPEKAGKTTFVVQFMEAVLSGTLFEALPDIYGRYPHTIPHRIIYYNTETSDEELAEKFGNYQQFFKEGNFKHVSGGWATTEEFLASVEKELSDVDDDCLVVVDTMSDIGGCTSERDASRINLQTDCIRNSRLLQDKQTSFLLVYHCVKDADLRQFDTKSIRANGELVTHANLVTEMLPSAMPNHVALKVLSVRSGAKPEQCFLLERVSEPGNHHFQFVKMVDEAEALPAQKTKPQTKTRPQKTRKYTECSKDEKDTLLSFWKEVRQKRSDISLGDLCRITLERYNIRVSDESIRKALKDEEPT